MDRYSKLKSNMYLITLILNLIFVSASTGEECLAPIFSIRPSLLFYRISTLDFATSVSVDRDFDFLPNETMMTYLLVATKELAEIRSTDCHEEFLEDLPLRPAHVKIGANNFTLLDIWWRNATNLQEPTSDFKLVAQYGLNPGEAKITYDGIYPHSFVIDGVGKQLRENYSYTSEKYPFTIVLKTPQLSYEYLREVTKSGKIVTRMVRESLKFSKLDFQFVDTFPRDAEIPQQRLSQKLAESWLLPIARRIKDRVVKPRVLNLSKTFFQPHKNALLKSISSEILDIMLDPIFGTTIDEFFKNNTDRSKDIRSFSKFAFKNFEQFRNNCVVESASWLFRQALCPQDDLYMHTFNFMYDIRKLQNRIAFYPTISWTSERIVRKNTPDDQRTQQISSFHRHWIVELVIVTDKNGFLKFLDRVDVFFFFDDAIPTHVSTNLLRSVQMIIRKRISGRFGEKK